MRLSKCSPSFIIFQMFRSKVLLKFLPMLLSAFWLELQYLHVLHKQSAAMVGSVTWTLSFSFVFTCSPACS